MIDISIIIPAYNNLDLLKQSLMSVLKQKNIELEVIVVDDSKSLKIENFIEKLNSPKIKYFKNNTNNGAVNNWNYGLTLAQGRYVTILHHDEYYEDAEDQLYYLMNNTSNFDIIISKVLVIKNKNESYSLRLNKYFKSFILNFAPSFLFFYNFIGPMSTVIFKNETNKIFNTNLKWYVDVDWYYRIFKNKQIKYIDYSIINSILYHDEKITNKIDISSEITTDYKHLSKFYSKYSSPFLMLSLNYIYKKLKFRF